MLSNLEIRNFQSLHHVALELDRFTVIVGASSSGKSALTRAMKTLTSNARGSSFITHGERICTIKAVTELGTVTLKRGKGTEDNEYTTVPSDPNEQQKTYTKLGGAVPEEVSAFIGIEAKDPINYAGQFDKPYLLGNDTSGGEVARVLGALTNVSVIFDGAREANRRKLAQAAILKTRATDLATIKLKAETYRPLKAQLAAVANAEKNLRIARERQQQLRSVTQHIETIEIAEQSIARQQKLLDIAVPDAGSITAAAAQLQGFKRIMQTIREESAAYKAAAATAEAAAEQVATLNDEYTDMLIEAGTCPTCKQGTEHLGHAA